MALIPKVPFVSGAIFTPEVATEMAELVFDNQPQYYGHFNKISDADLSDAVGSIKERVSTNELNLKVTAGTGLNANYAAGRAIYGTTIFTIGSSSVALTASSANFIYVGVDGIVRATTNQPPIVRALLAIVTTNTTGVVTVIDEREGYKVEVIKPLATTIQNFGGKGGQGAKVCVNNEVFQSGEYFYTDFTVPAGVTISVEKLAFISCSGRVDIQGTVNVTTGSAGGFLTRANVSSAYLSPGQGIGAGTSELFAASSYHPKTSPVGSGGSSGVLSGKSLGTEAYFANTNRGGSGGGGLVFEVAGNINLSGTINANGTDGEIAFDFIAGAPIPGFPGGGNNGNVKGKCGGGGGGSGGHVTLKCLGSLTISGTINCRGGRGGSGTLAALNGNDTRAESGSGGGGGWILLYSPNINTTGSTLSVAGGQAAAILGDVSAVSYVGYGGTGGSYAGKAGEGDTALTLAGGAGIITIQSGFVPY